MLSSRYPQVLNATSLVIWLEHTKKRWMTWGGSETYMDLRVALCLSRNESLLMTNTWRRVAKGPRGHLALKEQCYESRHLINNYKKFLFHSFSLTPDKQASP